MSTPINASWLSLREKDMIVNGEVTNANISVGKYWAGYREGTNNIIICGSTEEKSTYNCGNGEQ